MDIMGKLKYFLVDHSRNIEHFKKKICRIAIENFETEPLFCKNTQILRRTKELQKELASCWCSGRLVDYLFWISMLTAFFGLIASFILLIQIVKHNPKYQCERSFKVLSESFIHGARKIAAMVEIYSWFSLAAGLFFYIPNYIVVWLFVQIIKCTNFIIYFYELFMGNQKWIWALFFKGALMTANIIAVHCLCNYIRIKKAYISDS